MPACLFDVLDCKLGLCGWLPNPQHPQQSLVCARCQYLSVEQMDGWMDGCKCLSKFGLMPSDFLELRK